MQKISVCNSRACSSFGAKRVMEAIKEETGLEEGEQNEEYNLDYCGCLGWCSNSPNVLVGEDLMFHDANPDTIMKKIKAGEGTVVTKDQIDVVLEDGFLGDIE